MISTILLASCAGASDLSGVEPVIGQSQTSPDAGTAAADPGVDAGTPAAAAPAQPHDARCDGSIDASRGFAVSDTGACPGMMPAAPTCAADFKLCSGLIPSPPAGSLTNFASSDGAGNLLLSCANAETSVSGLQFFPAGVSGYGDGTFAALGSDAAPLRSGFSLIPVQAHDSFMVMDGSGSTLARAAVTPNLVLAGTDGAAAFWATAGAEGVTISMERFGPDGSVRAPVQTLMTVASGWVLGGAMDVNGHSLLLIGAQGEATAQAIWLAPDGHAETAAFTVSRTAFSNDAVSALPGGGVALGEAFPTKWHTTLATSSTQQSAAPAWLAARGSFQIVRAGKALSFAGDSSSEIVTPDGTSCGTLSRAGQVGLDGTFIAASADQTTFRVYPGLLQ